MVVFGVRRLKFEIYGRFEPFTSWALLPGEYLILQIFPELVLTHSFCLSGRVGQTFDRPLTSCDAVDSLVVGDV